MFFSDSKKNVLVLGFKTAGKSTVIDQLIQNKLLRERREETHGSKTREISIQIGDISHDFAVTDIGGSKQYQDLFWKTAVAKANGIIYVIDASLLYDCEGGDRLEDETQCPNPIDDSRIKCNCKSNEKFRLSREAKSFAFSILDTGKPILVFLNKMDLTNIQMVYSEEDMNKLYQLKSKYNTKIQKGSALTGENLFESVSWLFQEMN